MRDMRENRFAKAREIAQSVADSLSGDDSILYYQALFRPQAKVYELIGLYTQLAAKLDLHLRRLYFGLIATGDNERGAERATSAQVLERLPNACRNHDIRLPKVERFIRLLEVIGELLKMRNDIVHSSCAWQPDGDILVFAHANEAARGDIRTGERIAYWIIDMSNFERIIRDFEKMCSYIPQYTTRWLPKVRPWLPSYLDGVADKNGERANALLDEMEARLEAAAPEDI
jgi:hypothetical protein